MMIQKTVVITGAGIGIGRATALAFARRGYDVVVTDILESEGRSVVKEIEAEGGRGCFYKLDVTDSAAVDGVVREVESLNNGIDVVVANSGIAHRVPLAEMTDAKWDLIMDVDLKGVLRIVRAAAPGMKARRQGTIVALSSISGSTYGWDEHAHYSAAKAGVIGLVRGLAVELARSGIRVNGVAPGVIRTAQALSAEHSLGPEKLDAMAGSIPLGRVGEPADVADVIAFLASEDARYITGQVIIVDGGFVIQQY
jgi:3-oxoacyl-[acyl-carrier protein] reductase